MKDGFIFALQNGYTHGFQIDADMQHDLGAIDTFLEASKMHKNALICGVPSFGFSHTAPKARIYGRKITQFWIWINTLGGAKIKDAMCGFRLYPLDSRYLFAKSNAMDFDIEILLLAHFRDFEMRWISVGVQYNPQNPSHFRVFKDNLLLSKLHCKYFFLIPKHIFSRLNRANQTHKNHANPQNKPWHKRNEKAGNFLLKLTILLVKFLPRFALLFVARIVTFIYFLLFKNERKNLAKFYALGCEYCESHNLDSTKFAHPKIYANFYHFCVAICDKIAAWLGKIRYDDIEINDKNYIKELCSGKKGQILLMSHFGNIEVAHALSQKFRNLRIISFVYQKNTEKFLQMIDSVSGQKIQRIYVDEIDIGRLLELREILESGGHIGIMGDRVALNNKRNLEIEFFGKPCLFPYGAFIVAGLLECKISAMWCEKIDGKYHLDFEFLGCVAKFARQNKVASLKPLVQKYANSLQTHALKNPTQWFSFYDFWDLGDSQNSSNFARESAQDSRESKSDSHKNNTKDLF